jgi:tetratricopeptide (TPR) repeat protein
MPQGHLMDATAWIEKAHQHTQEQAWAKATEAYEQALALEPANAQVHNDLGAAYECMGQLDRAEQHYRSALQHEPGMIHAHYHLGKLLKSQGRVDEAQVELEDFLSLAHSPAEITEGKALLQEISGLSFEKCIECGNISTLATFFKSSMQGKLCPRCHARYRAKNSNMVFWASLVILLLINGWMFTQPVMVYYGLVNLALVFVLSYLLILPHELAHACLAWLTRGQVFEIRIGNGQILWEKPIGDLIISLASRPTSGFCAMGFLTGKFLTARLFLATSAGMLVNVLMLLFFIPGTDANRWVSTYAFREVFVFVNAIHLLSNLWPRKVNVGGREALSDGMQLLQTIKGECLADAIRLSFFVNKSFGALRRRDYAQAVEVCEAGARLYPNNTLIKNTQAVALLELGQHAQALALFRELLEAFLKEQPQELGIPGIDRSMVQAMLLNNVAYTSLFCFSGSEAVKQAYRYARQAFRMAPWIASIQGTWGAALIENGAVKEGIGHLLLAEEHSEIPKSRAQNLAYAAEGYRRLGDKTKADELLRKAVKLDSSSYLVRQVQANLRMGATGPQ